MPYELRLAQRRAMVWGSQNRDEPMLTFIGLYLVRLETAVSGRFPDGLQGGQEIGAHVHEILKESLRDSDIPGWLHNNEHLAVVRDVDPEHSYLIAQRFLTSAGRSPILSGAGIKVRMGFTVYPLSSPPDFPVQEWRTLLDALRLLSCRDHSTSTTSGFGMMPGPRTTEAGIPETDLIPLALQDPDSLVRAGVLKLQRIRLLGPL